jgi:hypothetical protein
MAKPFSHGQSLGMQHESIALNHKQNDNQWNGIMELLRGRSNLQLPLLQGKIMSTVFWDAEGVILVDIMPRCQPINSNLYIQITKTLEKQFSKVQLHKNVVEILNMTMHGHTKVSKQRKQSQSLDGLFLPTHHTAQILLSQISTSLKPSTIPSVGKCLEVMTRLLTKQRSDCEYKIQNGKRGYVLVSGSQKAVYIDKDYAEK